MGRNRSKSDNKRHRSPFRTLDDDNRPTNPNIQHFKVRNSYDS
jgi:hypothetical protein